MRVVYMLLLAYELHGIDLLPLVCGTARAHNFTGLVRACAHIHPRHVDTQARLDAQHRLTACVDNPNGCLASEASHPDVVMSTRALTTTLNEVWRGESTVRMQPHPQLVGVDGDLATAPWYNLVPNTQVDRSASTGTHSRVLQTIPPCQVLANTYNIIHVMDNITFWGQASEAVRTEWRRLGCTHQAE